MIYKPVIVGECNPYGGTDEFALYPAPDGCSGHRLCCLILGMSRNDYLDAFDRMNLCQGKWSFREAKKSAAHAFLNRYDLVTGFRKFILLGSKVSQSFDVPFQPPQILENGQFLVLNHPSGLCRAWNEPGMIDAARAAAVKFYPEISDLVGKRS